MVLAACLLKRAAGAFAVVRQLGRERVFYVS
jgi:hypothetical protein